ncbi:CRISPR-associated endonuclease Cas1 [Geopseudomonas aromaticivorans]
MEIGEFSHPKSIWTWPGNRSRRASIWLPYLDSITRSGRHWLIRYNGGELEVDLQRVDSILIYGAVGDLPVSFLDDLNNHRIPLVIHRKNKSRAYVFYPSPSGGKPAEDLLSRQIVARENAKIRAYIARTLIRIRLSVIAQRIVLPQIHLRQLAQARNVRTVRLIEAEATHDYWHQWAEASNLTGFARRSNHPAAAALDACSIFVTGLILRWLSLHHLSPSHGFLHEPVTYDALCYDLIEPYRHWMEDAVRDACLTAREGDSLTAHAIENLKRILESSTYDEATRCVVTRKAMLHGAVLALRAYLLKQMPRLILPREGSAHPGRPMKVAYRIPGASRP